MSEAHEAFLALILSGDGPRAEDYARQIFEKRGVRFLYEAVVQRALQEVGELWSSDRITVAEEHLATATAQSALAALYPLFPWPARGPRVLIACVQGELHDLGARMVADLLALDGWDEHYLGPDVSPEDLARGVRELSPRLVALSATLPSNLSALRSAIDRVRLTAPAVKILIGGRATSNHRAELESLGVDGIASNASEAVEVARAWK